MSRGRSPGEDLPVVVIAAAGRARRFSGQQKVVAEVGGRPAICRVAAACAGGLGPHRQVVAIGRDGAAVRAALGEAPYREYVVQEPPLGTGHALATALHHLEPAPARMVYFLCGDKPLLLPVSLKRLRDDLEASGAAMAFLIGSFVGDPAANRQGRVVQARRGTAQAEVLGIVERAVIDALGQDGAVSFPSRNGRALRYARDELLATREVNLSAYIWREDALREHIGELRLHPEKSEYFVTDFVEILRGHGLLVRAVPVGNDLEGIGIDTPEQLRAAQQAWQRLQAPEAAAVLSGQAVAPVAGEEAPSARR